MQLGYIVGFLGMLCIIPVLIKGAISDYKTRTFPKAYWNHYIYAAMAFTFFGYFFLLIDGEYFIVGVLLALSCISSLFFLYMGYNFGSGGDWRALFYIAWVAPAMIVGTVITALIVGLLQALCSLLETSDTPFYLKAIPFAIAICVGYIISVAYYGFKLFQ